MQEWRLNLILRARVQGSAVLLSRIWIVTSDNQHLYADLEDDNIHLDAGIPVNVTFADLRINSDGSIEATGNAHEIVVYYPLNEVVEFSVLNSLGVIA
jgi:hypothetical protein